MYSRTYAWEVTVREKLLAFYALLWYTPRSRNVWPLTC